MDIYALNSAREREHIIDRFESCVWTERFAQYGDFELHLRSTQKFRDIFVEGVWLAINASYRIMIADTIEDSEDQDGKTTLKVTGKSLEAVLMERVVAREFEQLATNTKRTFTGTPGDLLRNIFSFAFNDELLDPRDGIPNLSMDQFPYLSPGTIPLPQQVVTMELELQTAYEAFTTICTTYNIGFALLLNPDNQEIHFQVLTGTDRTSAQDVVDPVVFSPEMDNLTKPSEIMSSANYKNVALVTSEHGWLEVYAGGTSRGATGFDRRVLLVKASVKEDEPNKQAVLRQAGEEALAKHRRVQAFDGEITKNSSHQYAESYDLGDVTEMRKHNGAANYMRVSEQIFVDDNEGERGYPSLSLDSYIGPGSWYAYPRNEEWTEVDPELNYYDLK